MKKSDKECIIFKSYDLLCLNVDEEIVSLTRNFRDEVLQDSENEWLIERYYDVSRRSDNALNSKDAYILINEHLPFIAQAIKDQHFNRVIELTSSMLDYFEAISCERISA